MFGIWCRLEDAGYAVGARVLELLCHREKVQTSLYLATKLINRKLFRQINKLSSLFLPICAIDLERMNSICLRFYS